MSTIYELPIVKHIKFMAMTAVRLIHQVRISKILKSRWQVPFRCCGQDYVEVKSKGVEVGQGSWAVERLEGDAF